MLWQPPSSDSVSEPQEEDVFEHLDGGEYWVELGAVYLLPPDRHLTQGEPHHLRHLSKRENMRKLVTYVVKLMSSSGQYKSKTIDISFLYLQHLNIEGPSLNMQSLEYLPGSVSFNELKKVI